MSNHELKIGMRVNAAGRPGDWKITQFWKLGGAYIQQPATEQWCVFTSRKQLTPIIENKRNEA